MISWRGTSIRPSFKSRGSPPHSSLASQGQLTEPQPFADILSVSAIMLFQMLQQPFESLIVGPK